MEREREEKRQRDRKIEMKRDRERERETETKQKRDRDKEREKAVKSSVRCLRYGKPTSLTLSHTHAHTNYSVISEFLSASVEMVWNESTFYVMTPWDYAFLFDFFCCCRVHAQAHFFIRKLR